MKTEIGRTWKWFELKHETIGNLFPSCLLFFLLHLVEDFDRESLIWIQKQVKINSIICCQHTNCNKVLQAEAGIHVLELTYLDMANPDKSVSLSNKWIHFFKPLVYVILQSDRRYIWGYDTRHLQNRTHWPTSIFLKKHWLLAVGTFTWTPTFRITV